MPPDQTASPPSYQLPPIEKKPKDRRWLKTLLVVILAIAVVIGAAVLAFMYVPAVSSFASAMLLPQELKGALFLADGQHDTAVYQYNGFTYGRTASNGALVSASGNDIRVVRTPEGVSQIVVSGKILFSTTSPMLGITSDPGSAAYAVAESSKPAPQLSAPAGYLSVLTVSAADWRIVYHKQLATGALDILGPQGVEPVFVDSHTIAYISPTGINAWDITTGKITPLLAHDFRTVPMAALVSPDHTLIGIHDSTAKTVTVYRISPSSAQLVGAVVLKNTATAYALGNAEVYTLQRGTFSTDILKQAFSHTSTQRIGFLPNSLVITRFLIGSL